MGLMYRILKFIMSPTVFREDGEAKFWLEPQIELSHNHGLSRKQLKTVEKIIEERQNDIRNAWQKYFQR